MAVSVFDLFKIGIGPSSSHTVGPMRAARMFVARLSHEGLIERTARVKADLYGSLGATGKGHGSDKAVLLGLAGHEPDTVDIEQVPAILDAIRSQHRVTRASTPSCARRVTNMRAARIGPTVCELEGPMPILKRSKTETAMACFLLLRA